MHGDEAGNRELVAGILEGAPASDNVSLRRTPSDKVGLRRTAAVRIRQSRNQSDKVGQQPNVAPSTR